ncbi:sulfotransferase [Palleronia sp. LCG004]|uniref:sulfotransferase family protein n=1 Tax=Palleronia sp. LCG004 TaxID=3079304 RepID=UPI002942E85A|nr:sulfotransferase [Palleronia sp. LCG004]WOI56244.1 sulfotransferase [Palleronia sp. LCG004]
MLPHRYVFVGGLHRSGTSLVARIIAGLPGIAAIRNAPVPENEGVYLQGAIPHTARHGAPMHFATDPAQHHVEGSPYDKRATRDRMEADWAPFFGAGSWRVEKSPVNLTRMRLYQQLFPLSQFVVVIRHPEAVAGAVAKWVDGAPGDLIDHWIAAHEILATDLPFLHNVVVLRYEDLVARPMDWRAALAAFLGVPAEDTVPEDIADRNGNYLGHATLTRAQAQACAAWGYGPGMEVMPYAPQIRHSLNETRGAIRATLGWAAST